MKPSTANSAERDAERSEQCVRYLLDQMPEQEKQVFEELLAASPEMGDLLLDHASTIDQLAQTEVSLQPVSFDSQTTRVGWMTLAVSVALAACIGWALISLPVAGPEGAGGNSEIALDTEEDEALLIAKTWADDPAITAEVLVSYEDDTLAEFENNSDLDAPSWMIAAMSFDSDGLDLEDENDG